MKIIVIKIGGMNFETTYHLLHFTPNFRERSAEHGFIWRQLH